MNNILACKHITCGGAGLKINCYLGVLRALERACAARGTSWTDHVRDNVETLIGSSAGAIMALVLALGITADEIAVIVQPISEARRIVPNPDLGVLWSRYGLERGEFARAIIAQILSLRGLSVDITLARMHALTRRHFACTGTNVNTGLNVIFDHTSHPDLRVVDAVFISMCVPIIFAPVQLGDDLYVDGALTDNLPCLHAPEETMVIVVVEPQRLEVAHWSGYMTALMTMGMGAQMPLRRALLQRAGCELSITLPPCLRDRPGMDMTFDAAAFAQLTTLGYYRVERFIHPKLEEVVRYLVNFAITHRDCCEVVPGR